MIFPLKPSFIGDFPVSHVSLLEGKFPFQQYWRPVNRRRFSASPSNLDDSHWFTIDVWGYWYVLMIEPFLDILFIEFFFGWPVSKPTEIAGGFDPSQRIPMGIWGPRRQSGCQHVVSTLPQNEPTHPIFLSQKGEEKNMVIWIMNLLSMIFHEQDNSVASQN